MKEPDLWAVVLAAKHQLSQEEFSGLAKYRARALLVQNFRNVVLTQTAGGVADAHFVMIKLALTYSAIELAVAVVGQISIHDRQMESSLKSGYFRKLLDACDKSTRRYKKTSEISQVPKYADPKVVGAELRLFIRDCRNLVFHGSFTPSESGLDRAPKRRQALLRLSSIAIRATDRSILRWIEKRTRGARP
jgi:hypothetical protein